MNFFSETEYSQKIEPVLRKIFTEEDPYGGIFAETMLEKRIICGNEFYTEKK